MSKEFLRYSDNYDSFLLYWLKVPIFKRNHWGIELAIESQTISTWSMAIFKLVKVISRVLNQDGRFSAERTVYFLILMAYIEFLGTVYFQRVDRIVPARGPWSFLSDRMFSTQNCIYSPRAVYFQEPYVLSKNDEIKYFRKRKHIKDTSQAHTPTTVLFSSADTLQTRT